MGATLGQFGKGGLIQTEALRQALEGAVDRLYLQSDLLKDDQSSAEPSAGGVAGGAKKSTARRRNREGKVRFHGADRVLRYYKPTEAELDRLGELGRDAASAFAWMSFFLGTFANLVVGLVLANGLSGTTRAVGYTMAAFSLIAAIKFWYDGHRKRGTETGELERLKKDHDFTNI